MWIPDGHKQFTLIHVSGMSLQVGVFLTLHPVCFIVCPLPGVIYLPKIRVCIRCQAWEYDCEQLLANTEFGTLSFQAEATSNC